MRSLGGWLILLSVAAGMFYGYYVIKLSGSNVGEYALQDIDGSQSRQIGPIELSPDMNPIRVNLLFDAGTRNTRRDILRYEIALRNASGETIWQEKEEYRKSEDNTSSVPKSMTASVGQFQVQQEGEYSFEASVRPVASGVIVEDVSLELRRNVAGYSMPILAGIGGVGLLGIILAVVGRKRPE